MNTTLEIPTAEGVKAACAKFDRENELVERALAELLRQYPTNHDPAQILLKVVAVNSLRHASVLAVEAVARHLHSSVPDLDSALAAGSPDIVNKVAHVSVAGKKFNFYSFATKYCSWHNPEAYPVYDSRVDDYLWTLQKQNHFSGFHHADLWDYPKFLGIMTALREFHGLNSFSFVELGKFLYLQCEPMCHEEPEDVLLADGAFDFFPAAESRA